MGGKATKRRPQRVAIVGISTLVVGIGLLARAVCRCAAVPLCARPCASRRSPARQPLALRRRTRRRAAPLAPGARCVCVAPKPTAGEHPGRLPARRWARAFAWRALHGVRPHPARGVQRLPCEAQGTCAWMHASILLPLKCPCCCHHTTHRLKLRVWQRAAPAAARLQRRRPANRARRAPSACRGRHCRARPRVGPVARRRRARWRGAAGRR